MASKATRKTAKKKPVKKSKKTASKKSASKKTTKQSTGAAKKGGAKRAARKAPKSRKTVDKGSQVVNAAERIDQWIANLNDWRGERLTEIRRLIHEVDRQVVEEWKWMGTPVWSHEGMYALANPFKGRVKLTFFHGAALRDPKKLFNADLTGNKWRAINYYEGDKIDKVALKALLREAIAYNSTHKVAKSKGSRDRASDSVAGRC